MGYRSQGLRSQKLVMEFFTQYLFINRRTLKEGGLKCIQQNKTKQLDAPYPCTFGWF